MLSVSNVSGGAAASGYYKTEGYYIEGSPEANAAASWFGKAAETLAEKGQSIFAGRVDDATFSQMLEGHAPATQKDARGAWGEGQTMGRYVDGERQHRPGIDLTFSAPKSVSIMALVAGDERIIAAHDAAVKDAMSVVEDRFVYTRREENGEIVHKKGEMIAGLFRHDTSRAMDPQLHTHAVIQNMVLGTDGKWTALTNEEIYNNKMLIGALYRSALAENLIELGYEVTRNGKHAIPEIAAVPEQAVAAWSKRREEIEQALAARGKETPDAIDSALAALATRRNKQTGVDRDELRQAWRDEAEKMGFGKDQLDRIVQAASRDKALRLSGQTRAGEVIETPDQRAQAAVEFAIKHISERDAVYSRDDIIRTALSRNGSAPLPSLEKAIAAKEKEGRLVAVDVEIRDYKHRADSFRPGDGFTGRLIGHGELPYDYKPGNRMSYYVTIQNSSGTHTLWGAGLKQEMQRTMRRPGTMLHLAVTGTRDVTITDDNTGETKTVQRNLWSANEVDAAPAKAQPYAIRTVRMYSDDTTIANEKAVMSAFQKGKRQGGVTFSMGLSDKIRSRSSLSNLQQHLRYTSLTDGQKDAVKMGLSEKGRFVGVQGYAGTGKTYMLATLARYAEKSGYTVEGAAPTNKAALELQEAIPNAGTVARRLMMMEDPQAQGKSKAKTILVVDEAGMISTKDMKALMTHANKAGYARVVMVGDIKQLDAVAAGSPFAQLQKAGMPTALMADIQRQRDTPALHAAVMHSIRGEIKEAFANIQGIATPAQGKTVSDTLADKWLAHTPAGREQTGIVVLTNKMRTEVNSKIRQALKGEGRLDPRDVQVRGLNPLNLSDAEKRDAQSYNRGDIIIPFGKAGTLEANTPYVVTDSHHRYNTLTLTPERGGKSVTVKLGHGKNPIKNTAAYELETREFAQGDRVKATLADKESGIINGSRLRINSVNKTEIIVQTDNGKPVRLPIDSPTARGLQHLYAATAHDFQGATVNNIIVGMTANERLSDQKSFYVDISRARNSAVLVTDNPDKLADKIEKNTGERSSALDALKLKMDNDDKQKALGHGKDHDHNRQYDNTHYPKDIEFEAFEKQLKAKQDRAEAELQRILDAAKDNQKQKTKEGPIR